MSFADIINQAQKQLDQGGDNPKVEYPKAKNKKLFFSKDTPKLLLQILPAADLVSAFFVPIRTVYLSTITGNGKQFGSSFTLDAEHNPGSLLEQKVTEWAGLGMIPNGFGGQQSPTSRYLVNAVLVIQNPHNPQQWVQERDAKGELVVRVLELPQSALSNLFDKLKNQMLNRTGTELSFMDINSPRPIEITKPPKGKKEYTVELYNDIVLPPLGQGWEMQLEDLNAHAVPTERLVNGMQWVQAFVDMKEGRKPNQGGAAAPTPGAPAANPYAAQPGVQPGAPNPYANVPAPNPYAPQPGAQPGQPIPNPYAQNAAPQPNPYAAQPGQPAPNPYAAQPGAQVPPTPTPGVPAQPNPYAAAPAPTPIPGAGVTQPNPYAQVPPAQPNPFAPGAVPTQPVINMPTGMDEPTDIGEETDLSQYTAPTPPVPPAPPAAPAPGAPVVPGVPGATPPLHNVAANGNGLQNLDAMLDAELNGGGQPQ